MVAPRQGVPFHIVDTIPELLAYWSRAEGEPLDKQVDRFEGEVVGAYPSLYAENVLGLPKGDERTLRRARLAAWLPTFGAIVPRLRELHATFVGGLDDSVRRFRSTLPTFHWDGTCFLFASIDGMDGGMRSVGGRPSLLFGLDVIARNRGGMPIGVLFAHELFHTHHSQVQQKTDGAGRLSDALWAEGLAVYASIAILPGTTDAEALPKSHLHDPSRPAADIPERRVALSTTMPGLAATLGAELRQALDSEDDETYAKFFLGRAAPSLGERPVRSAYWFGLHVARTLARERSLETLARLPVDALRADIRQAIDDVVAAHT